MERLIVTSLLLTNFLGGGAAVAQGGYVGLSFGGYQADLIDDDERYNGSFGQLEGLYSWDLGAGALVVEGSYRNDNLDPDATDGDEMTSQAHVAAHYVYGFAGGSTVSGFFGYGQAPHDDPDEDYTVVYAGFGGTYAASDNVLIYGQLGYGDSPDGEELSSFGFYHGTFLRAGVTYTGWDRTAVSFELERAQSDEYEDEGEPGDFGAVYLGGVTALNNPAYQITYGIRSSFYDAGPDDGDRTEETSVSLGFRYVFGGQEPGSFERQGILGSPYLPLRASNWTPSLD